MSKELIRQLIIWAPTLLIVLILFWGFLVGLIRGFRKSLILFIHMLIAGGLCLGAFIWIVNDANMEVTIFNGINSLLEKFEVGSIQSLMNVSESVGSFKELVAELILSSMSSDEIIYHILNDSLTYVYALIEVVYRLVLFILLCFVYLVLIFVLYLIYFIFYPVRRKIKKHNKKFMNGEVSHPYRKRRLLGGLIGSVRSGIIGVIILSFLGATLFVITGGDKIPSRDEMVEDGEISFGDEIFNDVYDYYSYVCEMGDTGVFKVLNNLKDQDNIPFYFYISDLVLQGKIDAENIDVKDVFYLRDEFGEYVGFIKKAVVILVKYGATDAFGAENQELQMELLLDVMSKPGFAEEFGNLIDEFEAKPFMSNLVLSCLTTVVNRIDLVVDDEMVVGLVKQLFVDGEYKIKVTDLATEQDIKSLFKSVINVIAAASDDLVPTSVKTSQLNSESSELDSIKRVIKYAKMLLPTIQGLSLFNENADTGNKICKSLYLYCANLLLADSENESSSTNQVEMPNINWINEFNILFDATDSILDIVYYTIDEDSEKFVYNVLNMFEGEHAQKLEVAYDNLVGHISKSQLLDEALKLSYFSDAIDTLVINLTGNEEAKIPHQYSFAGEDGECHKLLTALKIFINNDGYEIYEILTQADSLGSTEVKKVLDLFTNKVEVNNTQTSILEQLLSCNMLHYAISSFLIYGNLGEFEIYIPNDSLTEVVEGDNTYKIVKSNEIKLIVNTVVDCFDSLAPLIDGGEADFTKLLTDGGLIDSLKQSTLLKGTIANLIVGFSEEQEIIVLPKGYDTPEAWLEKNNENDEIDAILEGVKKLANVKDENDKPLIDSLFEGNVDVSTLLNIDQEVISVVCESKVLKYTISNLMTNLGSDGFSIIVPAASIDIKNAETTKEDVKVNVVKTNEIVGIFSSIKKIVDFDDSSNLVIKYNEIFNNKAEILSNRTLHATIINLIITLADESESVIVIPQNYKTDFEKIKTEVNLTNNVWFGSTAEEDEIYKMISAVETFIEKDDEGNIPSDFDFANIVEDAKISQGNIAPIVSSGILNASISKLISSAVATPTEVYEDENQIKVSEYEALFDCLFALLNKTTLSFNDFNEIDPNILTLTSSDANVIKSSKIAMAMISEALLSFEGVYIPKSVISSTNIVPKGEGQEQVTSISVIDGNEFENLVNALVGLLGVKNTETNELEVSIANIDVDNIKITKSKLNAIKASEIIVATISAYLTDIEQIVIPVASTELTKLSNDDEIYVLKHSQDEDELGEILDFVIDLVGTGEGDNKEVVVSNIEFNAANITEDNKEKILESSILSATISNTIITSVSSSLVIPSTSVVSMETCKKENNEFIKKNVFVRTQDKDELAELLDLVFELFGTGEEGNKEISIDGINADEIKITKSLAAKLSKSDIINATIADKLVAIDSIVVPATAIESDCDDYTNTKKAYLIRQSELNNLFDKLIDLIGTDGKLDVSNIDLDKEIVLDNSLLENSEILSATISNQITGVESLVIPTTAIDLDVDLYNNTTTDLIKNSELKSLIDLIIEILGEENTNTHIKEFKINLNNPTINTDNLNISKAVASKLSESDIINATIADKLIAIDTIVIPLTAIESDCDDYTNTKKAYLIRQSELNNLFDKLIDLIGTDGKLDVSNIDLDKEIVLDNSLLENSEILSATISNQITGVESLVIPTTAIDLDVDLYNNTTLDLINNSELKTLIDLIVEVLGEKNTITNTKEFKINLNNPVINTDNLSIDKSLIDSNDSTTTVKLFDSAIFHATISKNVVEVESLIISSDCANMNIDIYASTPTKANIIKPAELENLFNGIFALIGADEIEVNNIGDEMNDIVLTHTVYSEMSKSIILKNTISNIILDMESLKVNKTFVADVTKLDGTIEKVIVSEENDKFFNAIFSIIGESLDTNNFETDNITITKEDITEITKSNILSATISTELFSDNIYIPSETVENIEIYSKTSSGVTINTIKNTELANLFKGFLVFSNTEEISINSLNSATFNTIKKSQLVGIFDDTNKSQILTTTISKTIYDVETLIKPWNVTNKVSVYGNNLPINTIDDEEVVKLFDVLFETAGTAVGTDKQLVLNSINTSNISLPTTEENVNTFVESYIISATISNELLKSGSSIELLKSHIVKYGDETNANNTEYYVLQSEIKDLVLALTSVGTSNITSLSNSISVPDVSKAESLTNSEIVRTTISKMVLDSNDVKVDVASCDIKKDRSNNDVVIIKAEELISIIQGISAIGGDFESLNLDITSILTFDEQDFEVISSSSIYRYLLTRELTKSFNSLKYYQLFTTTNDKVDLSGNGDIYTYKAFLMGEYTIQDPTQISAYSKYDDVTVTNIESFSKNDILALSKCTLNVM